MQALVVGATLAGSIATAFVLQRALLEAWLRTCEGVPPSISVAAPAAIPAAAPVSAWHPPSAPESEARSATTAPIKPAVARPSTTFSSLTERDATALKDPFNVPDAKAVVPNLRLFRNVTTTAKRALQFFPGTGGATVAAEAAINSLSNGLDWLDWRHRFDRSDRLNRLDRSDRLDGCHWFDRRNWLDRCNW